MSQVREKKVVRRTIAIALGITCIILAVGLGGAFAYIHQLNNQIVTLHTQLNLLNATSLNESAYWGDNVLTPYVGDWIFNKTAKYPGYIVVSTGGTTFASVELSCVLPNGLTYDTSVELGSAQTLFPILPGLIHLHFRYAGPGGTSEMYYVEISVKYYY
jgi:hypothetical protein